MLTEGRHVDGFSSCQGVVAYTGSEEVVWKVWVDTTRREVWPSVTLLPPASTRVLHLPPTSWTARQGSLKEIKWILVSY